MGGEGALSSPRHYSAVRIHQAARAAGSPLPEERKAGSIARSGAHLVFVLIVSTLLECRKGTPLLA